MSYRDDLKIDKHALDEEWMWQSIRFSDWGEKEVDAQNQVDKAKAKLELTKAKLDSKIRSQAEQSGKKITETYITNTILQEPEYQTALDEYFEAMKTQGSLDVGRKAFEHRKKALEKLTDLYLSNYWAEPRGKAEQIISAKEDREQVEALNRNPRLMQRRNKNMEERKEDGI
jgi:hypothetical protein